MKPVIIFSLLILLLTPAFDSAMAAVEAPETCQICGMNRSVFARSRMLVTYSEGTAVGVCSLHCAALELSRNKGRQVSSLNVADYFSNELLEAKRAAWVVGGKAGGVMTSLAKWAFSRVEDARRFIEENGGVLSPFEQAMNSATAEVMEQAAEEKAVESEMLRELQK